jgi:hypothetical protein
MGSRCDHAGIEPGGDQRVIVGNRRCRRNDGRVEGGSCDGPVAGDAGRRGDHALGGLQSTGEVTGQVGRGGYDGVGKGGSGTRRTQSFRRRRTGIRSYG